MGAVQFFEATKDGYRSLSFKDGDALYFCKGALEMFKGEELYARGFPPERAEAAREGGMGCQAGAWTELAGLRAPSSGTYQINAAAFVAAPQDAGKSRVDVAVRVSGRAVAMATAPTNGDSASLSASAELSEGDAVSLEAYSDGAYYALAEFVKVGGVTRVEIVKL